MLAEDVDLAGSVPPDRREQAIEDCVAPQLLLAPGRLSPLEEFSGGGLGLLVFQGFMLRRVELDARFGVELLGECDVLRPWQRDDVPTLPLRSQWSVLEPARVALLDENFVRQLGAYPELAARLFERAVRRSRQLGVNMAIVHHARVDIRLHLLFWHLASRWGRVRGDGVLVPLRLTHAVLADLVAARRPTVTSALSDLARRGLVESGEEGWLLLGASPSETAGAGAGAAGAGAGAPDAGPGAED